MLSKFILFTLLLFLLCTTAFGENATGTIEGRVIDKYGAAVPSADVSLKSSETGEVIAGPVRVEPKEGRFTFGDLPFGRYTLSTSWPPVGRAFTRDVEVASTQPVSVTMTIFLRPCADEEKSAPIVPLTAQDKIEIVTDLIRTFYRAQTVKKGVVQDLTLNNFNAKWLRSSQRLSFAHSFRLLTALVRANSISFMSLFKTAAASEFTSETARPASMARPASSTVS